MPSEKVKQSTVEFEEDNLDPIERYEGKLEQEISKLLLRNEEIEDKKKAIEFFVSFQAKGGALGPDFPTSTLMHEKVIDAYKELNQINLEHFNNENEIENKTKILES